MSTQLLQMLGVRAEVELILGAGRARIVHRGRQEWNSSIYQGVSKTLPSTSTVSVALALYSVCPFIVERDTTEMS